MLVDFSVVVSVIVLALDASDDNVVDGEDVPGVTVVVLVAKHPVIKDRTTLHFCLPVKKNSISISKAEVSLVHSHEVVISYNPVLVVIFSDISLKYKMLSYSNDIGFRPVHIKCRFYSYPQCPSFFILCFPK